MKTLRWALILSFLFASFSGISQDKISGQWYIGFQHHEEADFNQFHLKRAYISYKKQITPWMKGRITPDITIDRDGDGKGDVEFRMKYLYLQFDVKDFGIFSDNNFKVGLTPRPWIDYEQDIISYRAQGNMFLERAKVINSTDFGITYSSSIGGNFETNGFSTACPGKLACFTVGVFNGGGYNKIEENSNKTMEWRATIRPLPNVLPGLLASYHGAYGEGNSTRNNLFQVNGYHLAYEHLWFVLAAQYYTGIGNYSDSYLNDYDNSPIRHEGYSFFAEFREPKTGLGVWARYDSQFKDFEYTPSYTEDRLILSAVWKFYKKNKLIISRDYFEKGFANQKETIWEATLDIRF